LIARPRGISTYDFRYCFSTCRSARGLRGHQLF
jgi:hypothetical protein